MSEAAHGDDEDLTIKRVPILPSYHKVTGLGQRW